MVKFANRKAALLKESIIISPGASKKVHVPFISGKVMEIFFASGSYQQNDV